MKRPADQVKLLVLALLRSTATALATTGDKGAAAAAAAAAARSTTTSIHLRLATKADVSSIQSCNLECLPENYNSQFYNNHLKQWPYLALVAEELTSPTSAGSATSKSRLFTDPEPLTASAQQQQQQQLHQRRMFSFSNQNHYSEKKIVAYLLGKIESRTTYVDLQNPFSGGRQVETLGHVTSLAVLPSYRRLGLAHALMDQLHTHLVEDYGIRSCGLHVRASNTAACQLYQEGFGYEIGQIIPRYYQDGEDAYFMKKSLVMVGEDEHELDQDMAEETSSRIPPKTFTQPIWKRGPSHVQLPRPHTPPSPLNHQRGETLTTAAAKPTLSMHQSTELSSSSSSSSSPPELLTESM